MNSNGDNKATIDCPACQQRFSAEMPTAITVNTPTFSQIIAVHSKVIRCPNSKCAQPMVFALAGGQLQWMPSVITEEVAHQVTGSKLIAPFPSLPPMLRRVN